MSKFNGWLSGAAAFAMVAGPLTVAAPTDGWSQVDELIVTVRKREENLQDVPIAVGVFDSVQIERQGISDIGDIAKYTPSVQFDNNFGPLDNRVTIRGLSQTRGRPSAAILVDGIDVTSESVSFNGTGTLITQRLLDG